MAHPSPDDSELGVASIAMSYVPVIFPLWWLGAQEFLFFDIRILFLVL